MWLIDDARDFTQCIDFFIDSEILGSFKNFIFKVKKTSLSLYYGLFDNNELIAYYWLMKFENIPNTYRGHEFHVNSNYQKQGISLFLNNHILFVERIQILSDHSHTKTSSHIWDKFRETKELTVGTYNEITNEINWNGNFDKKEIYQNDYMHMIVKSK